MFRIEVSRYEGVQMSNLRMSGAYLDEEHHFAWGIVCRDGVECLLQHSTLGVDRLHPDALASRKPQQLLLVGQGKPVKQTKCRTSAQ